MHKILELLETSRVIATYAILDFKQGQDFYYIKAKAVVEDKSTLHIRVYISKEERLYSYHWQDNNDELMLKQYQARKLDFLKELVSELVNLNASSPRIHETVKTMIKEIEMITPVVSDQEISRQFNFSLAELETVVSR